MKKLLSIFAFLAILLLLTGCNNSSVTNEDIEDMTDSELLAEEIAGEWEGTVTGEGNIEYEILLTLDKDGEFTYQEASSTTSAQDQKLLEGEFEVDGDQLVLIVTENQDVPGVYLLGDVTEFTYELSTDYLTLTGEDDEIINLSRVGVKANQ